MDKKLNQVPMIRSKLRNKYLKSKSEIHKKWCNKQKSFCIKLLHRKIQKYYESLDTYKITDDKSFLKKMSLLFSSKSYLTNYRIVLLKKWESLSKESKIADMFNELFSDAVKDISTKSN